MLSEASEVKARCLINSKAVSKAKEDSPAKRAAFNLKRMANVRLATPCGKRSNQSKLSEASLSSNAQRAARSMLPSTKD